MNWIMQGGLFNLVIEKKIFPPVEHTSYNTQ